MWYGESERRYREIFRSARERSEQEGLPVTLFFDEIESIAGARDGSMRVDDRVLTAFMTELDGLEARGNVLVVAATNRRDAVDPALMRPGRLGDLVLDIPRPDRRAAHAILSKHLPPDVPYAMSDDDNDVSAARRELIDAAVSALYTPNGAPELATLTLRDGKRRVVRAPDLISGAHLANIAAAALETACVRELASVVGRRPRVGAVRGHADARKLSPLHRRLAAGCARGAC
jgi:SpoVK/Ycf46/Vps4 family AAA+-type ATPase